MGIKGQCFGNCSCLASTLTICPPFLDSEYFIMILFLIICNCISLPLWILTLLCCDCLSVELATFRIIWVWSLDKRIDWYGKEHPESGQHILVPAQVDNRGHGRGKLFPFCSHGLSAAQSWLILLLSNLSWWYQTSFLGFQGPEAPGHPGFSVAA